MYSARGGDVPVNECALSTTGNTFRVTLCWGSDAINSSEMLDFNLTKGTSMYASRQGYQAYLFEPMDTQHGGHVKLFLLPETQPVVSVLFFPVNLLWRRCV